MTEQATQTAHSAQSTQLSITRDAHTWTFTLNRADKRNALSGELVDALYEGVQQAHAQQAQLLVFRGAGKNFSAGFDFADLDTQSEGDLVLRFVRIEMLLQAISSSPCMTLALAHGKNFGAGVDIFASCKRRISTPDSSFRMPGLKFGLVLGTQRFGELVGKANARSILEETRNFDATEALRIGFVTQMAPVEKWDEAISEAQAAASVLDADSRAMLYHALGSQTSDQELALLVRSAARPGLKQRIARYLSAG